MSIKFNFPFKIYNNPHTRCSNCTILNSVCFKVVCTLTHSKNLCRRCIMNAIKVQVNQSSTFSIIYASCFFCNENKNVFNFMDLAVTCEDCNLLVAEKLVSRLEELYAMGVVLSI